MRRRSSHPVLGAHFFLALALIAGPAIAGEATARAAETAEVQDESAEQSSEQPVILDKITVTAQKVEQDQKDVPLSLTTLDGEELDLLTTGGVDIRFLSARVPSLLLESSFGRAFPRFYIRGLGNTDFDLNASQPVSMVYDEVVLENPIMKGMPVWDLERVEVLRGPQGTLFGRNTTAGIVKFESKKPSQEFDSFLRASVGSFSTYDLKGAVGGGLTETLSGRFSAMIQGRSDWVDNTFTGRSDALGGYENNAYRAQLLWQPNDRFSGLLNVHGWDVDGTARLFRANIITPGDDDLVAGFEQDKISIDGRNSQDIEAHGAVVKLEYDLGETTFTSITGFETLEMFSRGDIDGGFGAVFAPPSGPGFIPFPAESADGLPDLDQFTQELRLSSNGDEDVDWLVGVFYFDEDLHADTFSYDTLGGGVLNGHSFQEQSAEAWAVFGSIDVQTSDRWNLRGGLRFSNDEKEFSAERPVPVFQPPLAGPIRRSTDTDFFSWDASAIYAATENVNVYGRVATSFRAPSIQGRILFCPDFAGGLDPATNCVSVADEEEILSVEIGVKSELVDNKLRLNVTGYTYEVDGQQIVAVGGLFNTATLLNADKTDGYGFEADLKFAPNSTWLMTVGVSNNNTKIDDATLSVAPCGGGCTVLDPIGPNGALVDGNSLPHAPEWIFNGIIDYRAPIAGGLLVGTLDWAHYSEKQFFLYESLEFEGDSTELGLRVAYIFPDDQYEIALFGRNITDDESIRNGIDFNNLTGMTNDPRTWGLELVLRR